MIRIIKISVFLCLLCHTMYAQDTSGEQVRPQKVVYNFIFNIAPDPFALPLIGFVNLANGDFRSLQLGFVNTTFRDFHGAQIGFVNSTFNDHYGLQFSFVNTTFAKSNHLQWGFINTAGSVQGGQIGFLNSSYKTLTGLQFGFINTVRGKQFGSENIVDETQAGLQTGFINTTIGDVKGAQFGFINTATGRLTGAQIGFINYADTVTGVPMGFLSIVRKGGYRAMEVSVNEFYPVNMAFKLGVPKLYSIFQGSYNPDFEQQFALSIGIGTLLPLGKHLYFNPEISSLNSVGRTNQIQIQSLAANLRLRITPHLSFAAGPTVSHAYLQDPIQGYKPVFSIYDHRYNDRHRLIVGAKAAISVNF